MLYHYLYCSSFYIIFAGLKMPLFKIMQESRDRKVAIVASTIQEIIVKAKGEFALTDNTDYKVILIF